MELLHEEIQVEQRKADRDLEIEQAHLKHQQSESEYCRVLNTGWGLLKQSESEYCRVLNTGWVLLKQSECEYCCVLREETFSRLDLLTKELSVRKSMLIFRFCDVIVRHCQMVRN